jgi:AcrR family transcriptional regulator
MPTTPATPAQRPDRKAAILQAAQRLFAQHGYRAVTIRQIADAAAVPLALVGYHHGSKQALFQSVFAHWEHTLDERLARLRAVRIDPSDARTLPRIIEAFTAPLLALRADPDGAHYTRLVAHELHNAGEASERVLREQFDPLAQAYIDALHQAMPHATRGAVAWGYQFALGALLHHLSDTRVERLSRGDNRPGDPAATPQLVQFIVGGLRAALPRPRPATDTAPTTAARQRASHRTP